MHSESIEIQVAEAGLCMAVVVATGARTGALIDANAALVTQALASVDLDAHAERVPEIRAMLRHGRYKPSGRAKPASEYLRGAAREGRFPRINDAVDVANLVSLESALPVSLIDLDLAAASRFTLRRGRSGESYVFNPTGQAIELEDLLLVARLPADEPVATPVKDSQATKTHDRSANLIAFVYAPQMLASAARAAGMRIAEMLAQLIGAETRIRFLPE